MSPTPPPLHSDKTAAIHTPGKPALSREPRKPLSAWILAVVCTGWLGLWFLTPGLISYGPVRWFASDLPTIILAESLLALVLVMVLVLLHRRYNTALFARSKQRYLYAIPLILAIALPFHYGLPLPVFLYMFWMTVSVFWQDYLTFGLLQSYLRERLPATVAVPLIAVMFYLGHAIFIPDRFAPPNFIPGLAIFTLGLVLALLRTKLKAIHLILALHLSFYFIFA